MTAVDANDVARGDDQGIVTARVVAKGLHLAAAPTFAIMALVTATADSSAPMTLCAGAAGFGVGGMAPMYLLMAVFHLAPWLKLISRRYFTARA